MVRCLEICTAGTSAALGLKEHGHYMGTSVQFKLKSGRDTAAARKYGLEQGGSRKEMPCFLIPPVFLCSALLGQTCQEPAGSTDWLM